MKRIVSFALSSVCAGMCWSQTVLTLQPDALAGEDAILHGTPAYVNTNYGSDQQLPARAWTYSGVPGVLRAVFKFDLSSIPSTATISSAELSLYAWGSSSGQGPHSTLSGPNDCWLERVTTSWSESTVTWNTQPATTTVNRVSLAASTSANQNYLNIDVTTLTQDMISNPSVSFGYMLKLQNESYYRGLNFCSSDHSTPSLRPKLVITYVVPGMKEPELNTAQVSVFPNPSNGIIHVNLLDFDKAADNEVTFYNSLGQSVKSLQLQAPNSEIDLKNLSAGIYFYQLRRQGRVVKTGKFVMEQ